MSLHADLLEQASHLARRERRRPRQASLRRATSAAYYALFHLLTHEASRQLISGGTHESLRQTVQRAFRHADMKAVARQFASGRPGGKWETSIGDGGVGDDVMLVAEAFVRLQEARHTADYNTGHVLTRQETLAYVDLATQAFEAFRRSRTTRPGQVLLVALLLHRSVQA